MAYVYSHVRVDTGVTFYIGCSCLRRYDRAYQRRGRSKGWKKITSETDYEVRILLEGLSCKEVFIFEKMLIKLYGRSDKGEGELCNLTDGGDKGSPGYKHTKEALRKIRKSKTGVNNPSAKLSVDNVMSIRREIKKDEVTMKSLAKKYGVTYAAIFDIVRRRNWKSI